MPEQSNNNSVASAGGAGGDGGSSMPTSQGVQQKDLSSLFTEQLNRTTPEPPKADAEKQKQEAEAKAKAEADARAAEAAEQTPPATDFEKQAKEFQSRYDKAQEELRAKQAELDEYNKDPLGTVKKKHPQVFENLEAASDLDGFLGKWQKTTLMEDMKKKFPDMGDGWQFDASEAYTPGTPSYQFRVATEEKRTQLIQSLQSRKAQEEAVVKRYVEQRDKDLAYIKETYSFDDAQLTEHLKQFDSIHQDVLSGKQPAEKHPFALRNLMRGMFFEELVKIHVDKAIKDNTAKLIVQYREKGYILPELQPTDITKVGSESSSPQTPKKASTPFGRQMEKMLETH